MFEIETENYENLKVALESLLAELKEIHNVQLNTKTYKIQKMLGGDMKSLSLLMGIVSSSGVHTCCWCHCDVGARGTLEIDRDWAIERTQLQAAQEWENDTNGYHNKPLIDFIEYDCVVIDLLHLLLRISDQLFNLF